MFVGSFLMVVGVTLSSGDETVLDMAVAGGDLLEDDGRAVDRGTKELEGLLMVVVGSTVCKPEFSDWENLRNTLRIV